MTNYGKYNIVYRLQKWMDTAQGQTFLNYAYSWGASIVILGALFKLTYLPGADVALFLGMGTEVLVFFISAFDRPFDKTAEGREMPTRVTPEFLATGKVSYTNAETEAEAPVVAEPVKVVAQAAPVQSQANYVPQMSAEEAAKLNEAQGNYVEELKKLVETLSKVNEQSERLTRDSEEMENLNRTLTGISRVYEMQLKGASKQIGTIDQINEQTTKMAQQIEQLNKIYTRMIQAMTVNMKVAASGATTPNTEE
ncbi:MAG: gliding motility protein GldL [Prevotella sp.]|jgi:gliding motility-associated protein GldL|nr:gliding motility protein GldL [Prevotella sp.]